jgi:hypothetical protein
MLHPSVTEWSLAGAAVVTGRPSSETARLAAGELSRYLFLITGQPSPVVTDLPPRGTAVVLDSRLAAGLGVEAPPDSAGGQGYRLATRTRGRTRCVVIASRAPVGLLYGVYGLLEELGCGFYAGGDSLPDRPSRAAFSVPRDRCEAPAFKVRGNMLHYNFLCGCTAWGLADYRFYFDQLARMRGNMLLMHWYDSEPGAAYEMDGEYLAGGRAPTSLDRPWGALAALRTAQFSFGTGRFFDEELFTSPMGEDRPHPIAEIRRSEAVFAEATRYARRYGIGVAAGFEAPRGDPTDPETRRRFEARVRQFLARNPALTHLALWEHESGGCVGLPPPAGGTGAELLARHRARFAYLGNMQRVWEAIRFEGFAKLALGVLAKEASHLPLVLVGWGGDRWMQFADYCLGFQQELPPQVIFTCHDNIDASMSPNVSTPWGQLPPDRERWAMPWVEGDIDACDVRQPHVESLGLLAPDALRKGCQGLLTLQWRTRDVEEETGYIARFAWDSSLTPEAFYRDQARRMFGPDQEADMGRILGDLQRLGARWTGVRGSCECGMMKWGGFVPHFPFEVGELCIPYLMTKVEEAIEALAEIPAGPEAEAAFHLLPQGGGNGQTKVDVTRLGVADMNTVLERLKSLASTPADPASLRREFRAIEETIYALRPSLVAAGMSGHSYRAVDVLLFALHHLWRNAGAADHYDALRRVRRQLAGLREGYGRLGRTGRLEALDYLAATLDFAMPFDAVTMLLADGERIDQALAEAAAKPEQAAVVAKQAYAELVAGGMAEALAAFTRKLTTRCDFGTLATINIKPLPAYWEAIGKLESLLPAAPPREIQTVGRADEVWLAWEPDAKRTVGQNVYRRRVGGRAWRRVNRKPLAGDCRLFVDRPAPGRYEYTLTALAADGWESPASHAATAICGPEAGAPILVACKPFSAAEAGRPIPLRVVALSDRGVAGVRLLYRSAGERRWQAAPMTRRFRDSYAGVIPGEAVQKGILLFYIEATDAEGRRACWPGTAPERPWSATVTPPR